MSYQIALAKKSTQNQVVEISAEQPQILDAVEYRSIQIQDQGLRVARQGNNLLVVDEAGNTLLTVSEYYGNEFAILGADGSQYAFFNASIEGLTTGASASVGASTIAASQVAVASASVLPYALGIGAVAAGGVALAGGSSDKGGAEQSNSSTPTNPTTPSAPATPNHPVNPPSSSSHAPVALSAKSGMTFIDTTEHYEEVGLISKTQDGKILALAMAGLEPDGIENDLIFAKYLSHGELDKGFGNQGISLNTQVIKPYGTYTGIVTAEGKLLIAGGFREPPAAEDFVLARYEQNGQLDSGFGQNGKVITEAPEGSIYAVAQTQDGKYIAVGTDRDEFVIARYHQDGTLDQRFGDGGTLSDRIDGFKQIISVAQLKDQSIVVLVKQSFSGNNMLGLMRYNADGTEFLNHVSKPLDQVEINDAITVTQDNKIIVTGGIIDNGQRYGVLMRFNADLSLDESFGDDGVLLTKVGGEYLRAIVDMVETANGDLMVVGKGVSAASLDNKDIGIIRYDKDGNVVSHFGNRGKVFIDLAGEEDFASVIVADGDKFLIGGSATRENLDAYLMRLNADGSLDNSFGDNKFSLKSHSAHILTEKQFAYSDADDDALVAIKITDLPDIGRLLLNGSAVADEQKITISDIEAGKLSYAADNRGSDKFSYKVIDSGVSNNMSLNEAEFLIQIF